MSSHKKWFGDDDDEHKADNNSLGSAAAMQALKMFAGQGSKEEEPKSQNSSAFVAIAMSEASKVRKIPMYQLRSPTRKSVMPPVSRAYRAH